MKGCLEWLLIHCQFSFQFAFFNNWNQGRFGALFQGSLQMTQLIPQSRIYSSLPIPMKITEKPLQRSALTPPVFLFSCTFNYLIFTENLNSSFLLEWNIAGTCFIQTYHSMTVSLYKWYNVLWFNMFLWSKNNKRYNWRQLTFTEKEISHLTLQTSIKVYHNIDLNEVTEYSTYDYKDWWSTDWGRCSVST